MTTYPEGFPTDPFCRSVWDAMAKKAEPDDIPSAPEERDLTAEIKSKLAVVRRERDRQRAELYAEYEMSPRACDVAAVRMSNASTVVYAAFREARDLLECLEYDQEHQGDEGPQYRIEPNDATLLKLVELLLARYNHQDIGAYPGENL
jgi:hypothetical protein